MSTGVCETVGAAGILSMRGEGEGGSECPEIQGCFRHSATLGRSLKTKILVITYFENRMKTLSRCELGVTV